MSEFKDKFYTIEDFITLVSEKKDRVQHYDPTYLYSVYGEYHNDGKFKPSMNIYVGDAAQVDDDENEIFPKTVSEMNLSLLYSCENFQDVVDLAVKQKPNVTSTEVINALNYYSKHDDFMDLD